jgi:hypothetical protein
MSLCRAIGYMLQQWKSETVEYKLVKLVRAFFTAGKPLFRGVRRRTGKGIK